MSDRVRTALGISAAVPVGVCAVAAGAMLLAGDERVLALEIALPGVVLGAGALVSAIPAVAFLVRIRRSRWRERVSARVAKAAGEAAERAGSAERARHRRFLARLDHELKNPLTAIRATAVAAQVAPGDASGSDSTELRIDADAWRTVDAQALKLSTLVRDLRKLADLENRALEREAVDLESLVNEAIAALAQQDPGAGARIAFVVTRVPWPVPTMQADPDLLSLAIDNVLGNAAKYSSDGTIEVRLREENGSAILEIADSGRGIPAEDLPAVFDELARAQNARGVSGSGIGLTLVATVMRRHDGDVWIRSVVGAGTVVTLRLH